MSGLLIAVVGPSGAGKDTLLDFARTRLGDRDDFVFAERTITRAEDAGIERHRPASPSAFARDVANGAFALTWSAHGLHYGIAIQSVTDARAGRCVVANLSRSAIAEALDVFPNVHVIRVSAPDDVLAARLAGRGRETPDDVAQRRVRTAPPLPDTIATSDVVNDRPLEVTGPIFVAALLDAVSAAGSD